MNQLLSNLEFGDPSRLRTVEPHWFELYRDLHAHPELSGDETRTAAIVAEELRRIGGWDVTVGVGGTGVVGVLEGSSGPVILLRADMDALPVAEDTGLSYASRTDGVMHACGHDVHVTALLATWRSTFRGSDIDHRDCCRGSSSLLRRPAPALVRWSTTESSTASHDRTSAWDSTWARLLRGCWSANPTS